MVCMIFFLFATYTRVYPLNQIKGGENCRQLVTVHCESDVTMI